MMERFSFFTTSLILPTFKLYALVPPFSLDYLVERNIGKISFLPSEVVKGDRTFSSLHVHRSISIFSFVYVVPQTSSLPPPSLSLLPPYFQWPFTHKLTHPSVMFSTPSFSLLTTSYFLSLAPPPLSFSNAASYTLYTYKNHSSYASSPFPRPV